MQLGKTWQMKMLPYLIKSKHLNMNLVTYPTLKVGLMTNWKPLMSLEDSWIDPPLPISQPIPSSQPWCPAGFDNTAMFQPLLESLDRSINLQTANAKDHYISSAKVYDGINPEEFDPWLDEVSRLSNITHKIDIEIALCTSKGDLHQEINEMVECNYGWNTIQSKLRAKYSDYGTPDMAIQKLSTFKQGSD